MGSKLPNYIENRDFKITIEISLRELVSTLLDAKRQINDFNIFDNISSLLRKKLFVTVSGIA